MKFIITALSKKHKTKHSLVSDAGMEQLVRNDKQISSNLIIFNNLVEAYEHLQKIKNNFKNHNNWAAEALLEKDPK